MLIIFYISLCIVVISIFLAIKNRSNISVAIRCFAGGVFGALLLMTYAKNETGSLANFFTALQIGTLNADYGDVFDNLPNQQSGFVVLYSILTLLAPVALGGTLFSFFASIMQPLSFKLFRKKRDCYIFSDLNEKSYLFALSIVDSNKKALVTFINSPDENEKLIQKSKQHGFLFFQAKEKDVIFNSKNKRYYFAFSENEAENLSLALGYLDGYINGTEIIDFSTVKIFLKSEQEEAELIINKVNKKNLEVVIFNQAQVVANTLLFDFPLYNVLANDGETQLEVLIVGGGKTGKAILKSALMCGQLGDEYSLKIKLIDKDAQYVKAIMAKDYPEFNKGKYNIEYFDADVKTDTFTRVLNEQCNMCNYIVVCLETDELSIQTALYLKKYYTAKNISQRKNLMVIARIRDEIKSENLKIKTSDSDKVLLSFGSDADLFSFEKILNDPLDKLALNAHSTYCKIFSENSIQKKDIIISYYQNETNRKSDKANALHIPYKLFTMGYFLKPYDKATVLEIDKSAFFLAELENYLNDKNNEEHLSRMEHNRWMVFQSSDGWQGASFEQALEYSKFTHSHKFEEAKLHACICTWEELEKVQFHFDSKLKTYDINFIKQIPSILGLREDADINLSDVRYVLCKRQN